MMQNTPKNKTSKTKRLRNQVSSSRQLVTTNPLYNVRIAGFPNFNVFNAFPTTMRCTLPYCEVFGAASGTSANTTGTSVNLVANSLFAPMATGHQPYSFDQLCSATGPYTKYKVLGFKCKFTATNSTANAYPLHLVVKLINITDNYSISSKLLEDVLEKPGSRFTVCPSSGTQSVSMEVNVPDLSVLFNWSKEQYTADTISSVGSYGSSPSSLCGVNLAVANAWSNSALFLNVTAEFWFDVVFTERQSLPSS